MELLNLPQMAKDSKGLKKNKRYPFEYKIMIVEEAKKSNNCMVARVHGLDEKVIRNWRKDELKYRAALESGRNLRLAGGGRKFPRP